MKNTLIALILSSFATVATGQVESEAQTLSSAPPAVESMQAVGVSDPGMESSVEISATSEQAANNYTATPVDTEAAVALAAEARFGAEFWFNPRNGDAIMQTPQLRAVVRMLLEMPEAFLVISYPEGESGELWGLEMQAWLVSLGISSDRVELRASTELLESVVISLATETQAAVESPEDGSAPLNSLNDDVGSATDVLRELDQIHTAETEAIADDAASDEGASEVSLPAVNSTEALETPQQETE